MIVLAPVAPVAPLPAEIGFRNTVAVRIALFAAVAVFLMMTLSVQILMNQGVAFLWLGLSGFGAVFLYYRRTGQSLSIAGGARLGWLAGLFAFVISLVLLTFVALALEDPATAETWRQQMSAHGAPDANTKQMLEALRSPSGLLEILLALFIFFTLLPTVGGALGARVFRKSAQAASRGVK